MLVLTSFAYEHPSYETIKKYNKHIHIRKYSPSKWVGSTTFNFTKSQEKGPFFKLFQYISGNNDQNQVNFLFYVHRSD